jgi:hypothetical protein
MTIGLRLSIVGSLLLTLLGPAALALSGPAPEPGGPVLVLTAPWRDAGEALYRVGGWQVGPRNVRFVALGQLPDGVAVQSLYRAGASAVVDGRLAAALCGVPP